VSLRPRAKTPDVAELGDAVPEVEPAGRGS